MNLNQLSSMKGGKNMSRYVYYQPNKKDLKDDYGDCTIRALSKALNLSWLETFDLTIPYCREYQIPNIFFTSIQIERIIMKDLGFDYTGISNKKGTVRPTVESFAAKHPEGVYILNVANHEVACVDGKYYDTWDCGRKSLYGYYTLNEKKEVQIWQ